MGETTSYHHGQTIKEYRILRKMTQTKLAEQWPRHDNEEGVSVRYVQDVEYGVKKIIDPDTLRKLSILLDIPLWKFGLSEYDPFNPTALPGSGRHLYDETLDVVEVLLKQTLGMRNFTAVPLVEKNAKSLERLFAYFLVHTPPSARLEPRFITLYVQQLSLKSLMFFEHKQYDKALATNYIMYDIAKESGDPMLQVHALQKIGVELNRAGKKNDAVNAVEEARDLSFQCGKHLAAWNYAYLAHIYAAAGDALHFERSIHTAQALAAPLGESYGNGTDFVFHKQSGILHLRSRGYLRIGEPEKTLALHEEVRRQVATDANIWLDFRLHLYRARAYLMLGEVEACIEAARAFLHDVVGWQSSHRAGKGLELLEELEEAGCGEVKMVQDFRSDLLDAVGQR